MTDSKHFSKEEIKVLQKAREIIYNKDYPIGTEALKGLDIVLLDQSLREPKERKVTIVEENMNQLIDNLSGAFAWDSTHEGFDYWNNILDRLIEIRDTQKY